MMMDDMNPGSYRLTFGKYKRKLLSEIDDLQYLEWCTTTHKIVEPIKKHIQKYLDSINYVAEQKVDDNDWVLTFGKHKGKCLKDIDTEYLEWMLTSDKIYDGIKTRIRRFLDGNL
jgi:uncharacterized protein (DUF3820 family)